MLLLLLLLHASSAALETVTGNALTGQRVLVTGGGRGIGRAIAIACAQEGASHVALLARSEGELQEVADAICKAGAQALVRTVDITEQTLVNEVIAGLAGTMGGIDVLINNAGNSCSKGLLHEQSTEEFKTLLELNVVAMMGVTSSVLRHAMLPQRAGRIINISSRAGKLGIALMGPYVASKFAVEGLTATLAEELRAETPKILVNSLSPGMVDTRAFPKAPGRPGVRSAESVRDGLLAVLQSGSSGTYLHVDEYDAASEAGAPERAFKPINEPTFDAGCMAKD